MDDSQSSQIFFSEKELKTLLSEYVKVKELLEQKHSMKVTEKDKTKAWKEILAAVNALSVAKRDIPSLKKKIADMKKYTREWVTSFKAPKTRGGKAKKEMWYYRLVLEHIIGSDSPITITPRNCNSC